MLSGKETDMASERLTWIKSEQDHSGFQYFYLVFSSISFMVIEHVCRNSMQMSQKEVL